MVLTLVILMPEKWRQSVQNLKMYIIGCISNLRSTGPHDLDPVGGGGHSLVKFLVSPTLIADPVSRPQASRLPTSRLPTRVRP